HHCILTFGTAPGYLTNINWLETVGRPENDPRKSVLKINNVYGLRRAVQTGMGIASIPDYIVGRDTNLVMVPFDVEPPSFDTYLVYPEELRSSKRVAVFRDFMASKSREWSF
ncbi:unnamed protein product, partial [marine sediment metagenome]